MKKFSLLTCLVALLSFAACTNELDAPMGSGEEVNVTFTANLASNVLTRAFSDGTSATDLYYAVFLNNESLDSKSMRGEKLQQTNGVWEVTMNLVRGLKYDVVFWAQAPGAPYVFNPETGQVTYAADATFTSNNDEMDAFFHKETIEVTGPVIKDGIVLRRALAQINVGTDDLEEAMSKGLSAIETSYMKVERAATGFDLLNGVALSDTRDIEFAADELDAIKEGKFYIGSDTYDYLARNYVFATENVKVSFTATYENGTKNISYDVLNVPVATNYRTNIFGSLLTDPTTLTLKIDNKVNEGFNSPDTPHNVSTVSDNNAANTLLANANTGTPAQTAMNASQDVSEVVVPTAYVNSGTPETPASVAATWETAPENELNFSESGQNAENASTATPGLSKVENTATAAGSTALVNSFGPNSHSVFNTTSSWNIEKMNAGAGVSTLVIGEKVTVKTLNFYYGSLIINGTVETLNYTGKEGGVIYYVGNATTVDSGNGTFVNMSLEELALRNAIANPSVTAYTLNADIESTLPFKVQSGDFALNLNGHAIKVTGDGNDVFVNAGGNLTINGNGSVTSTGDNGYAVVANGGKTVINGGTYKAEHTATSCIYAANKAVVEINGGHFSVGGPHDGRYFVLNKMDGSESTISVKGGEFENYNPAKSLTENPQENFVADGYISYQSSENVYTVVPATSELSVSTAAALNDIAEQGGKVKLNADLTLTSPVYVKGSLELDLNGKNIQAGETWEGAGNNALFVVNYGGTLTLNGNGTISSNNNENVYTAVAVTAYGESTDETNPATLVVNGNPAVTGYYYAVAGNGSRHNTDITINGGTYKGEATNDNTAIFHPQDGRLTIKGGNFEAYNAAVEMRAGTLDIAGGSFKATAPSLSTAANGSGTTIVGSAIAISQHTTNKKIVATVSGGTFEGAYALYEDDMQTEPTDVTITISGGTFNGLVDSKKASKFTISGGVFNGMQETGVVAGKISVTGGVFNKFNSTYTGVSYDAAEKTFTISDESGLRWMSKVSNKEVESSFAGGPTFSGRTLVLADDITMSDELWTRVGDTDAGASFNGTFDGNEKTISNLKVTNEAGGQNCSTGLFGWITGKVQNLNISKATIIGHHYTGVIVGYMEGTAEVLNCHVSESTVHITHKDDAACGDKAGAIAGVTYGKITGCTATDCSIKAARDAGQIIGMAASSNVVNCSATNVTVEADTTGCTDGSAGNNIKQEIIGRLL